MKRFLIITLLGVATLACASGQSDSAQKEKDAEEPSQVSQVQSEVTETPEASAAPESSTDIAWDTIRSENQVGRFFGIVDIAGLTDELKSLKDVTILIPDDDSIPNDSAATQDAAAAREFVESCVFNGFTAGTAFATTPLPIISHSGKQTVLSTGDDGVKRADTAKIVATYSIDDSVAVFVLNEEAAEE